MDSAAQVIRRRLRVKTKERDLQHSLVIFGPPMQWGVEDGVQEGRNLGVHECPVYPGFSPSVGSTRGTRGATPRKGIPTAGRTGAGHNRE